MAGGESCARRLGDEVFLALHEWTREIVTQTVPSIPRLLSCNESNSTQVFKQAQAFPIAFPNAEREDG
jgi:hypothetical protein